MLIARHPSDGQIGLSEDEKKEIKKLLNNDSGSN